MEFLNKITDEALRNEIAGEVTKILTEKEQEVGRLVNEGISKAGDSIIEKDLKPLFGIERLPDEKKFSDYVKRAVPAKLKELETAYEKKISEISAKSPDETLKNEFESLKTKYSEVYNVVQSKQSEIESLKNDYENKFHQVKIDSEINKLMPPLMNDEINKYKAIVRRQEFFNQLGAEYDLKFNEAGELIAENKKTFVTKPFEQLAKESLKDVILGAETKVAFNPKQPQKTENGIKLPPGLSIMEASEMAKSFMKEKYGKYNVLDEKQRKEYNDLMATVQ
jgi:hypothetical protein